MSKIFYMPSMNLLGRGALADSIEAISKLGLKKALIVTDRPIVKLGFVTEISQMLNAAGVETIVYKDIQPNPTIQNVEDGLQLFDANACDSVISIGGGSVHDGSKAISLVAANRGNISQYEGLDKSKKPMKPLIAINTTAGTGAEMTRFVIITNPKTHVKMAIVDKHTTPLLSVNDPELMKLMPRDLTAAVGIDALTHAIEGFVSTGANHVTDACAEKAIELIGRYLLPACDNGDDMEAREAMCHAQFLAGMCFNSSGLGHVHSIAHQLGGLLDLPHGVCNAVLLPHVQRFNSIAAASKLSRVASLLGVNVSELSDAQGAEEAVRAIERLSEAAGITKGLSDLGVSESDFNSIAENALKDACGLTNPVDASHSDIVNILKSAF